MSPSKPSVHNRAGNCYDYPPCKECGIAECDVCHVHDEPRNDCDECPRCPLCDLETA